jgi:serine/threonine protein kinase
MEDGMKFPGTCPFCSSEYPRFVTDFKPGAEIGGYRLLKILGVGGMGVVYLAEQKSVNRKAALKVLPAYMARNKDNLERFFREVRTLAKIEHNGVVQAIESGAEKDICYFSMNYIPGKDLKCHLLDGKVFSEAEGLRIIRAIARTLWYVWEKHRIIHRDIKPGNIMLTPDGDVKLMDLGISKSLNSNKDLTAAGMMVGSPSYMSPEQARATKEIDFRTDIYSLGATYYHMITGIQPYDADTSVGIIARHMSDPIPDPRDIKPGLSRLSTGIISKSMQKKPEDRYPDWMAFISDINKVYVSLGGESDAENVPEDSAGQSERKIKIKLNPGKIAALLFLLVFFLMALGALIRRSIREEKIKKAENTYLRSLELIEKNTMESSRKAIQLLDKLRNMKIPAYSRKAEAALLRLKENFLARKALKQEKRKKKALDILKKKSYRYEREGRFQDALELWEHYGSRERFRGDRAFLIESSRAIEYLKRKIRLKREGLLDE